MNDPLLLSRRRALKTIFCSSACLSLNLISDSSLIAAPPSEGDLDFLILGDFGTSSTDQKKVAAAMVSFCKAAKITPEALLMVGDNFYSAAKDGFSVDSIRWKNTIEEVYLPNDFPGPMWAVLGNHDYYDNIGGELVQIAYTDQPGVRWKMPAKWFRFDLGPESNPYATVIALDSNMPARKGSINKRTGKQLQFLTEEEEAAQDVWFAAELKKPRAPFTIVMAHHPLYSNSTYHGDSPKLIKKWGSLLQEHKIHAYLCGHDHDLQHLELEGKHTSFLVSGGGGARTRAVDPARKMPFGEGIHGFTHMRLNREKMMFTHHDSEGKRLHTFTKNLDGSFEIA